MPNGPQAPIAAEAEKKKAKEDGEKKKKTIWWRILRLITSDGRAFERDEALAKLSFFMILGFFALVITSLFLPGGAPARLSFLGLSSMVALAASTAGALLGFIFGIPRSLRRADAPVGGTTETKERRYRDNTNLEDISDWLTKIIVGVSLTQWQAIQHHIHTLCTNVANGLIPIIPYKYGYAYVGCLLLLYGICGFLAAYLWAKIYLLKQLINLEKELDGDLVKQVAAVNEENIKLKIVQLENMITEFNRNKNRVLYMENQDEYREIFIRASPKQIKYLGDTQKDRWGGKPAKGGYQLTASFEENRSSADYSFDVTLTVSPIDSGDQLTGVVYFALDESFIEDYIMKATAADNKATITFPSFEAFTAAAIINGGAVTLELDLNSLSNCPPSYQYPGTLLTYDEVKADLDKANEKRSAEAQAASVTT